ncbi:hypothetical protein DKX38_006686 [Salix brachista]|uniref:Uncharacterized protein n=1 Tax=Salix brachista TaxID=2182728 RepID=A0A5N5N2Z7_9ROSI|nr:hypothetical protein DKX38_006686 [Salix brachista]
MAQLTASITFENAVEVNSLLRWVRQLFSFTAEEANFLDIWVVASGGLRFDEVCNLSSRVNLEGEGPLIAKILSARLDFPKLTDSMYQQNPVSISSTKPILFFICLYPSIAKGSNSMLDLAGACSSASPPPSTLMHNRILQSISLHLLMQERTLALFSESNGKASFTVVSVGTMGEATEKAKETDIHGIHFAASGYEKKRSHAISHRIHPPVLHLVTHLQEVTSRKDQMQYWARRDASQESSYS